MSYLSLNGTWRLYGSSGERGAYFEWPNEPRFIKPRNANVPGTVQEAFEDITGDLTEGHNILNARFIEEQKWLYVRDFELSQEDIQDKTLRIVFARLDLVAEVFINGKRAGGHNNFYTPCKLNITPFVKEGKNTVAVIIESGLFWSSDKSIAETFGGEPMKLTRRIWQRKPQSAYEWDWSPRLSNVGVYDCGIEITNGVFADNPSVFATINEDGDGEIEIRQFVQAFEAGLSYRVQVEIPETGDCTAEASTTQVGENVIVTHMKIDKPERWHVRGYGTQRRYSVIISVFSKGLQISSIEKKVGFRTVEIDQSKHPKQGKYFILTVNGDKVFAKGGNLIPSDIIFTRLTRDVYETLLDRAEEANLNAMRVWGGGMYETDDFYDLCDERGFIVWQDFVNACANYPGNDKEFYNNYAQEIRYNIRRLSVHPSLMIYAGNNEIDWQMQGVVGWNVQKYPDAQLYYWLLPKTLLAEGEKRYYQPSSPWSSDATDANSPYIGDQHPWSIGFTDRDYWKYRTFEDRFPNEGGVLGPTSLPCMLKCLGQGMQEMHSFDWAVHDNSIADRTSSSSDLLIEEKLGMSTEGMTIPDYVYFGGFLQGEGLTEYVLNYRSRMFSSGSAIFWMYNDCWPAVRSWTIVDYLKNRTPSFHPVRRACEPVCVNITKNQEEGTMCVLGINETKQKVKVRVEYGTMTTKGEYKTAHESAVLDAGGVTVLAKMQIPEEGRIPYAILTTESGTVSRRRFIEQPYQTLDLCDPEIRVKANGDGTVTYESDGLALGVCIDLDGTNGGPSDNFFDLFPGKPYTVRVGNKSGEVLHAIK